MSNISSNPLDGMNGPEMSVDEKIRMSGMEGSVDIGPWVREIISASSPHVTKDIINMHLELCRVALNGLGYIPDDSEPAYQEGFKTLVSRSQVFIFDEQTKVLSIDEERVKALNEIKQVQQAQRNYHTVDNLTKLVFNREPRQYRRVRKKITFVHDKVLVEPILAVKETEMLPFTIRETANSNPENDKVVMISNQVANAITTLSRLSSTGTKERNSVFLRGVYRQLLLDIENCDKDTYKFQDLLVFFSTMKEETYQKYATVMRSIYDKLGVKQPRKIGFKNSPSIIGKTVHDYLMSEAPDAVLARELIEQYNIVDIV